MSLVISLQCYISVKCYLFHLRIIPMPIYGALAHSKVKRNDPEEAGHSHVRCQLLKFHIPCLREKPLSIYMHIHCLWLGLITWFSKYLF